MSISKNINSQYKRIKDQEKALKLWVEKSSNKTVNKESIGSVMK